MSATIFMGLYGAKFHKPGPSRIGDGFPQPGRPQPGKLSSDAS